MPGIALPASQGDRMWFCSPPPCGEGSGVVVEEWSKTVPRGPPTTPTLPGGGRRSRRATCDSPGPQAGEGKKRPRRERISHP